MFDPTKLESPLNLMVDEITPDISGVILNKLQYRVIELRTITPYRNTAATLKYFIDENDTVGEIREIEYDRVDIGEYIKHHAKFEMNYDNTPTYVLVTDDINVTTKNAGPVMVSKLLNKEYNLPITADDLQLIVQPGYYTKTTSFGDLYLLSNALVSGDTITYTNGNVSVYYRPDTMQYSYNKVTTTQPGLSFYREWNSEETLEISLPTSLVSDSWSLMIEDVNSINMAGNGKLWIDLKYNIHDNTWSYLNDDDEMFSMVVDTVAKLKINVTNNGVVIEGLSLVNNNTYVTQFKYTVQSNGSVSGLNRITMYSSNPFANPISYKFKTSDTVDYDIQDLKPNYKSYTTRDSVIVADPRSNGICGAVKYPIRVTKYDTNNYLQVGSLDEFVGGRTNTDKAMVSTVDSFASDKVQILSMHIQDLGARFIDGTISKLSYTVTSKSNLLSSFKVELSFKNLTESGAALKAQTYINGNLVSISNYDITSNVAFIVVSISGYGIGIVDNNDTVLGTGSIGEYSTMGDSVIKSFKVKMDMIIDSGSELPLISIMKEYTNANEV